MVTESERINRYLEDELDECRVEDVEMRLSELDMLQSSIRSNRVESDLAVLATLGSETRYRLARVLADADGEL
ncbi:MAG: transcriptional regulator, partial [Halanaeroarchaeum sp.]